MFLGKKSKIAVRQNPTGEGISVIGVKIDPVFSKDELLRYIKERQSYRVYFNCILFYSFQYLFLFIFFFYKKSCLHRGSLKRTTGTTSMNATSSRSHAIFTIYLKQRKPLLANTSDTPSSEGEETVDSAEKDSQFESNTLAAFGASDLQYETLHAKFHFVDLAGSERVSQQLQGKQYKFIFYLFFTHFIFFPSNIAVISYECIRRYCKRRNFN